MPSVLAYGDSNTHGTMPMRHLLDVRRYPPDQRWTHHAAACLPGDVVLLDEGQPGRTTVHDDPVEGAHKNGLALLPAILETHRPLDAVVLMLGTNDMKARFAVTPMDVALSLARLAAVVQGAGAGPDGGAPRLLIVAPPPIAETGCLAGMFAGGAGKSRGLAPLLGDVAARLGAGLVDAGAHVAVSPVDGIHLEPDAQATLGRVIGAALARMLDLDLP